MAKVRERPAVQVVVEPLVNVRVTLAGDGKVSNGVHHPMLGDEYYEHNDEFRVAESIALELQKRGYVEIAAPKAEHVHVPADYEDEAASQISAEPPNVELSVEFAKFDHDGDGAPGGSRPRRGRPPKA